MLFSSATHLFRFIRHSFYRAKVLRADEYGVEEEVTVLQPAPLASYAKKNVFVPDALCKWLRPHQREGVQFMYECVMSLRDYKGSGCILAGTFKDPTVDGRTDAFTIRFTHTTVYYRRHGLG